MKPDAANNHRTAERFPIALPITLEGEEGATHDISATGVLFESNKAPRIGALVDLTLSDGDDLNLSCRGEVVRVERHGDGYNVAVRLSQPLFNDETMPDEELNDTVNPFDADDPEAGGQLPVAPPVAPL